MNITSMKKDEIIKRHLFHCKHGHTGLSHPKCYQEEHGPDEKLGFLDIETTGLRADYGFILSYCIRSSDGTIIKNLIKPEEIHSGVLDKRLVEQLLVDIRKFDRLLTYYGARFDIPFIRTRSLYWGLDFPCYKELKHTDVYDVAKRKLCLRSKRLGVVCDLFKIPAKNHQMSPEIWNGALTGNQKALNFVLTHNIEDVDSLETLWNRLEKFARVTDTSI